MKIDTQPKTDTVVISRTRFAELLQYKDWYLALREHMTLSWPEEDADFWLSLETNQYPNPADLVEGATEEQIIDSIVNRLADPDPEG